MERVLESQGQEVDADDASGSSDLRKLRVFRGFNRSDLEGSAYLCNRGWNCERGC
jgi:hypothetical protein